MQKQLACLGALWLIACGDPSPAAETDAAVVDAALAQDGGGHDAGPEAADAGSDPSAADAGPPDGGAVPAGDPVWVGVGAFGLIGSTRDAVTWWQQDPSGSGNPHTTDLLRDVAWNNGVFIAVGGHTNSYILRSSDGVSWTDSGSSDPGPWLGGVAGHGDTWVAAGGTSIVRSTDNGMTWAAVSSREFSGGLRGVGTSGDGTWVVTGDGGTIAVSEDDGLSWSDRSVVTGNASGFGDAVHHAGTWLLAGRRHTGDGFDHACVTSTDAVAFTPCTFDYGEVYSIGVHDGALYVFAGSSRSRSPDGTTWETTDSSVLQAAYGGGTWVAKRYGQTSYGPTLESLTPADYGTGFRAFAVGYVP